MRAHDSLNKARVQGRVALLILGAFVALALVTWAFFGLEPRKQSVTPSIGKTAAATSDQETLRAATTAVGSARNVDGASERVDVKPPPVAESPKTNSQTVAAGTTLDVDIERVAATFLSKDPDVVGMRNIAVQCAEHAVIDASRLHTDPAGVTHGTFQVADSKLHGTFEIEGEHYRVNLPMQPPAQAGSGFFAGGLTLNSSEQPGPANGSNLNVQFHPDSRPGQTNLAADEARIVGWTIAPNDKGTVQFPISMRRDPKGSGLIVGHVGSEAPVVMEGDWDVRANDAWLAQLRKFKPAK